MFAFVAWRVLGVIRAWRRVLQWLAEGAQCLDVQPSPADLRPATRRAAGTSRLDELVGYVRARPCAIRADQFLGGPRHTRERHGIVALLLGQGFARILNAGSWRNLP
ncbi:MAG: hypothetical protein U1F11_02745 [Steroidobacteraceae bacterium]